ncbi:MAG TPA: UvrD-helicase domain-containing protein, partial [Bryobacteraceae bacterium]|nr:UvrD-helicase domain-containing protein [Bryobacteraceae bacterium]
MRSIRRRKNQSEVSGGTTSTQAPSRHVLKSAIVEASAGTGKTRALVNRIADAVEGGASLHEIAAVTFTHAAAGEMKLRLRSELEDRRLPQAQQLEQAFVGTIHSFCAQMLRQRPVEACVDPMFSELSQLEASGIFARTFARWFEQELGAANPVLERALGRLGSDDDCKDPAGALRLAAWSLTEWRDFDAPWRRDPFDFENELDAVLDDIDAFLDLRSRCTRPQADALFQSYQPVQDFRERLKQAAQLRVNVAEQVESDLIRLLRDVRWAKPGGGPFGQGVTREQVIASWQRAELSINSFIERSGADLAAQLRDTLWPVVEHYAEAKRREGVLDFHDLLLSSVNLLENEAAREYFQRRYRHVFVDEFQDTDPLQARILLKLARFEPDHTLFLVGDPKQSIYRFRRADLEMFQSVCSRLREHGVDEQKLGKSHRSTQTIQGFVNAAFENRMQPYLPLTDGRPPIPNQPAVIALPMPTPYSDRGSELRYTKKSILQCGPSTVAAFVDWLVHKSGWRVSVKNGDLVPVRPEHICILFRRFTNFGVDLTSDYVRSLEVRGLPHVLVGSKSFHGREEIGVLRAALRAIEWPEDELSVFATLRGPLFAISDAVLLRFRNVHCKGRRMHPFMQLPPEV